MKYATFAEYMKAVDRVILARTGLTSDCLPDYCYADAYRDNVPATVCASRAIKAAKEY